MISAATITIVLSSVARAEEMRSAPASSDGDGAAYAGYGGPALKLTRLAETITPLVGAEGSWIVARSLLVGGAAYASASPVSSPASLQPPNGGAHLTVGYAGFRVGAILWSQKPIHVTVGVLVGGGVVQSANAAGAYRRHDDFTVVEPDLASEFNVARHLRIGFGGSYRFAGGSNAYGYSNRSLSGPALTLTLRLGAF